MAAHNELGKLGEELAANWLGNKGYSILERNWRSSYQEIDLVVLKGETIHFVEVKLRTSRKWGSPEGSVGKAKFQNLRLAADEYLRRHVGYRFVQFDILSITAVRGEEPEYFWIGDVWL